MALGFRSSVGAEVEEVDVEVDVELFDLLELLKLLELCPNEGLFVVLFLSFLRPASR